MSETIEKYITKIREAAPRSGFYAYRGQANSQWPLHSAATRRLSKEYGDAQLQRAGFPNLYSEYHREKLVEPARARGFDVEQGRKVSDLQLLAKLQHFGAATGLLDFTWSPLVALWFASQDPTCDGRLFIVNMTDPLHVKLVSSEEENHGMKTIFTRVDNSPGLSYWEPVWGGDAMSRILRQRSVFLIGRPLILEDIDEIVRKISIDKDEKPLLLKDLELLDVTESSLFQDIYGFSKTQGAKLPLSPQIKDLQEKDPKEYLRRGNQFYQRGDYAKAIEAYSTCITITSEPGVCEAYFLRGNAKAASGDHEKAIEDYDKAVFHKDRPFLNFNPILFMVYFNRGNAKSVRADYKGALEDYTKAIEENLPDHGDPALHLNRANTYADLNKFKEAVAEYDKVIDLGFPPAHFNKGNALVALGRFNEAFQCYQESALNGMDRTKVDQNLYAVGRIIQRTHGREYRTDLEASGPDTRATILITIVGEHSDPESLIIVGTTGNTGNFGGRGLSGGKGLSGKLPLVVQLRSRNEDEG